jgi:hypothetical protein
VHWSSGEKAAIAVLVSILIVFSALFGLAVYANGPGLCGAFGPEPCPSRESLNMMSYAMNSPTNVTLKIINSGSAAVFLASYYVRNSNGQAYATNNWLGPTISPSAIIPVNILIDGNSFTFTAGNSYTVIIVTSRNNQYTFTVQA